MWYIFSVIPDLKSLQIGKYRHRYNLYMNTIYLQFRLLSNQELSGAKSELQGETVGIL